MRSPAYHLDIVNHPYVNQLVLEYHYPAYTNLTTKRVEHGGDIAAPEGTSVIVRATTTMPVQGGRIVIGGRSQIPLTLGADGVLTGMIPMTASGFYKIELQASNGNFLPGSLDYSIDILKDKEPTVVFLKPGRYAAATPTGEMLAQVEATDDFGVARLELRYSVNGGPERIVPLHAGAPHKEIVAGYTFLLKALALKLGDVMSYYAQATDNDAIHGGKTAKTDLYFLNIQNKSDNKKSKQGAQSDSAGQFVRQQREIIIGTFNVDRNRSRMSATMRRENPAGA